LAHTEKFSGILSFSQILTLCAVTLLIILFGFEGGAFAETRLSKVNDNKHAGELQVPVHQSEVVQFDVPFANVLVGNPKIADVLALTDRSIYVLGKALGTTSVMISDRNKRLIAIFDVVVSLDVEGLKSRLFEVMPKEKISVRDVNGSLMLSGTVSSAAKVSQALKIAGRYTAKEDQVVNLMSVKGSQQVMLAVRFAEVARSVVKELGLNTQVQNNDVLVRTGDAIIGGLFSASSFITGSLGLSVGSTNLTLLFDALEQKGVVKTLAEPNLIALSGDTASFLAGGEFPVPIAQDSTDGGQTITIQFKEFGVSLSFTPTVLEGGLINILAAPEVSKIDRSTSVNIAGFNIPGLKTSRARTTVELYDGQSFAIAGLIQSDFEDTIREVPGLGQVPVLSGLFRSTDFNRRETELVIIVTPHLVKPAEPGTLKTPIDNFSLASDPAMYLFGRVEGTKPDAGMGNDASSHVLQGAGGIRGNYGHIIK